MKKYLSIFGGKIVTAHSFTVTYKPLAWHVNPNNCKVEIVTLTNFCSLFTSSMVRFVGPMAAQYLSVSLSFKIKAFLTFTWTICMWFTN